MKEKASCKTTFLFDDMFINSMPCINKIYLDLLEGSLHFSNLTDLS